MICDAENHYMYIFYLCIFLGKVTGQISVPLVVCVLITAYLYNLSRRNFSMEFFVINQ